MDIQANLYILDKNCPGKGSTIKLHVTGNKLVTCFFEGKIKENEMSASATSIRVNRIAILISRIPVDVFLAWDDSSWVIGEKIVASGGSRLLRIKISSRLFLTGGFPFLFLKYQTFRNPELFHL